MATNQRIQVRFDDSRRLIPDETYRAMIERAKARVREEQQAQDLADEAGEC